MEGRSTLAAVVARSLREFGIPVTLDDHPDEAGDAEDLLGDRDRFARNVNAVAARERVMGRTVEVRTRLVAAQGEVNLPGEAGKLVQLATERLQAGQWDTAVDLLANGLAHEAGGPRPGEEPLAKVVPYALNLGHLDPPTRSALGAAFELAQHLHHKRAAFAAQQTY